jgi:hypothetical protein
MGGEQVLSMELGWLAAGQMGGVGFLCVISVV